MRGASPKHTPHYVADEGPHRQMTVTLDEFMADVTP